MAVVSRAPSADVPKVGQTIGKYTIVVELGQRVPPIFAAHAAAIGGADPELVVLEAVSTSAATAAENDAFVKRARRLAQTRHPNVCRVRDVVVSRDRIVVASDFVDGETLAALLALDAAAETKRFGLPERLRILVDVLSGMSSIHLAPRLSGAGDKDDSPLFHGAIHPKNIVVGADGGSRLIRAMRAPFALASDRSGTVEEPRYAAPEILLGDATSGAGVDIYAVGVLLWEALSGTPLFTEEGEKEVLARQLAGALPPATPPKDLEWASALVEIAARALEVDPEKRFLSTSELAGALRLAVQARLAATSRVGNAVTASASEKIADRKGRLRAGKKAVAKPTPTTKAAPETNVAQATNLAAAALPTKRAIVNSPKITLQKQSDAVRLPSEPDDLEAGPATKRMRIDSIADEDLELNDDNAVDSTWSSAPPAKKASVAPPLKKPSVAPPLKKPSVAPPLKKPSVAPPLPTRAADAAPHPAAVAGGSFESAPPLPLIFPDAPLVPTFDAVPPLAPSSEDLETIAPVVSQSQVTPAISTPQVPRDDVSGAVIMPPAEDPQRRRRRMVVFGMVAFAALILLIAGVKHLASGPPETTTIATATTATTTDRAGNKPPPQPITQTPSTPPSAVIADPPVVTAPTSEPTLQPVSSASSQPTNPPPTHETSAHDPTPHAVTPPKPPHKKPPHSSYEPEGI